MLGSTALAPFLLSNPAAGAWEDLGAAPRWSPSLEILLPSLAILGGFVLLVWGADRFVAGAAATARNSGVSPLVVGLTIVGFGTSAPEMLVSSVAAFEGAPNLSVGNAVGSNIANTALVLGIAALVNPIQVPRRVIGREIPMLLIAMIGATALLLDGNLGRVDGAILFGAMIATIAWALREGLRTRELPAEIADEMPDEMGWGAAIFWLIVGLTVLLGSSELLVWGATATARYFGVSERIIGLTVVAFGTSLPELAATVIAAKRDEHDIAVGNIVGSNLFNTLGVLGLPGLIRPGECEAAVLRLDIPVMIGATILLWLMARVFRPFQRITRIEGVVLMAVYVGYLVALAFVQA